MAVTYEVIQDTVLSGTASIGIGANAEITIRDADTAALVTLFQDRLGAGGETNPFNADANGQFRVYTLPKRLQISIEFELVTRVWEDFRLGPKTPKLASGDAGKSLLVNSDEDGYSLVGITDLIANLGFTVTLDSPDAGDITVAIKQADNSTDPDSDNPIAIGFPGQLAALLATAADSIKLDSTDDFGLDDRAANTELFLFLYAIDRNGTLEWGVGPRADFTRATADFTAVEGEAVNRDHVFCTAAITANDPCRVVGYFKATYDTSAQDWSAVTSESDVVGPVPGPHPRSEARAWIKFDGTGTIAIDASHNVLSITDNGTGDYTITWDTDFASAEYCATVGLTLTGGGNAEWAELGTFAAGSLQVTTKTTAAQVDATIVCLSAFGDQ